MFELARVVAVHPESHTVDVVIQSDGRRCYGVKVMTLTGSTNTGVVDLPAPEIGSGADPGSAALGSRELIAVVGFVCGGLPIVFGFLFPQVSQLMFEAGNARVHRHSSDVYTTITDDGEITVSHPSGTFIKIGEDTTLQDLTGKDFDKVWKVDKNTKRKPGLRLVIASYSDQSKKVETHASLSIAPTGEVTLTAPHVTVATPEAHFTGNIVADGDVSDKKGSMQEMRDTYNDHTHAETGGTTKKPNQEMS